MTGLMDAVVGHHNIVVSHLISCQGIKVNKRNFLGQTALHLAVLAGNIGAIQEMLKIEGILVDTVDHMGKPLIEYAKSRDGPILQLLMRKLGAQPINTKREKSSIKRRASEFDNQTDVVKKKNCLPPNEEGVFSR